MALQNHTDRTLIKQAKSHMTKPLPLSSWGSSITWYFLSLYERETKGGEGGRHSGQTYLNVGEMASQQGERQVEAEAS